MRQRVFHAVCFQNFLSARRPLRGSALATAGLGPLRARHRQGLASERGLQRASEKSATCSAQWPLGTPGAKQSHLPLHTPVHGAWSPRQACRQHSCAAVFGTRCDPSHLLLHVPVHSARSPWQAPATRTHVQWSLRRPVQAVAPSAAHAGAQGQVSLADDPPALLCGGSSAAQPSSACTSSASSAGALQRAGFRHCHGAQLKAGQATARA